MAKKSKLKKKQKKTIKVTIPVKFNKLNMTPLELTNKILKKITNILKKIKKKYIH